MIREGDTADGGMNIYGDAQWGGKNGRTRDRVDDMGMGTGQVEVPAESRTDVRVIYYGSGVPPQYLALKLSTLMW